MLELLTILTLAVPMATPGWTEIGPERGHVMEAAVGPDQVSVVTRVGVLTADADMSRWSRDPRFPPDCFVIEYGPDGVGWAGAGGRVWRVGDSTEAALALDGGTHAVELAVTGKGSAIVAARGQAGGVYRIGADGGQPGRVLADVDPWALLTRGTEVWVGTLGEGVWHSDDDGKTFEQLLDGGEYTGLGQVRKQIWAGDRDGNLRTLPGGDVVATLPSGWVLDMVPVGDLVLLMAELPGGQQGLFTWDGDKITALGELQVDEDPGRINYTGAWALADGSCMVGTFRRGPLVFDGTSLTPRRDGFRATVVRGAVQSGDRFTLALMGTGVYTSSDDWQTMVAEHTFPGPVTDTVSLGVHAGSVVAVDFDGVTSSSTIGAWDRFGGVDEPGAGRPNALADVGVDAKGRWWGVTENGNVYLRDGDRWSSCAIEGGKRFDGTGETLRLATGTGFVVLEDCASSGTSPVWKDLEGLRQPTQARSVDSWLAGPGGLWRNGKTAASLPDRPVDAIAARGDEVLVVQAGEVLRCEDGSCAVAALSLPQTVNAVGWLGDGRIWVAEARGTLLATGGERTVEGWSDIHPPPGGSPRPPFELFRVPWSDEGRYTGGPPNGPGDQGPGPGPGPGPGDPGPGNPGPGGPGPGGPGPGDSGAQAEPAGESDGGGGRRVITVVVVGAALMIALLVFRPKRK